MTSQTQTRYSAEIDRIEDFPGYDNSLGFFVEPGERLLEERCPECGSRMLMMPMSGLFSMVDCPWCMNHRKADGDKVDEIIGSGFPYFTDPDHSHDSELSEYAGLWICGPDATRKACSVARAWSDGHGSSVRYVTEFDLFSMPGDRVSRLYTNGLVVVDSLGVSGASAWGLSKLCAVLHERQNAGRPTVLASIFAPSKVLAKYSEVDELTATAFKEYVRCLKGVQS